MKDFTLLGFAEHLGVMATEMVMAEHEGLERAAVMIETEAKESLGIYQQDSGPFGAWPELAEATQEERARLGFPANEPELRTGELRDSIQHAVQGHEAEIGSDSPIMEYQELGTPTIPPRSILGGAAYRKGEAAAEAVGEQVVAVLMGGNVIANATRYLK